jgi:hypothetical protein
MMVTKSVEASRLVTTYVMPARICAAPPSSVIRTYEATSITSNATNRSNRSPVRKASAMPAARTR